MRKEPLPVHAKAENPGLFEMAHQGTIFLDEVNDMSKNVQARLLRVLQEKQVMRLGDDRIFSIDVRVIAATNKDLFTEAEEGRFRKDLYYRLKILDIEIPPLRQRPEDIVPLFTQFIQDFQKKYSASLGEMPARLIEAVIQCPWPGNVRQLRNFAEKASVLISVNEEYDEIIDDLIQDVASTNGGTDAVPGNSPLTESSGHTLKKLKQELCAGSGSRTGKTSL